MRAIKCDSCGKYEDNPDLTIPTNWQSIVGPSWVSRVYEPVSRDYCSEPCLLAAFDAVGADVAATLRLAIAGALDNLEARDEITALETLREAYWRGQTAPAAPETEIVEGP